MLKVSHLVLVLALFAVADATIFCEEVAVNYTISVYDGNCFYGTTTTYEYAMKADHEVLTLNTVTNLYEYKDINTLVIGDVVQSPFGTTTITGLSTTTLEAPYIAIGQIFNEDTLYSSSFNPYAVNELLRWVAIDPTATTFEIKSLTTSSYVGTLLTIDYRVPEIDTNDIQTHLGVFNSANMQLYGTTSCNGTTRDIYYYDPKLLMRSLTLDTLYRSFKMMSFNEYFEMVNYALSQPDGTYFDGIELIYDVTVTLPSCAAVDVTTADGYLILNGLVTVAV